MNFLTTLSIAGYRGFNENSVINLAIPKEQREGSGLTIITGANNSGMSTVIEALLARSGHQTPSFSEGVRNKHADFVRIIYEFEKKSEDDDDLTEVIASQTPGSSQANQHRMRSLRA